MPVDRHGQPDAAAGVQPSCGFGTARAAQWNAIENGTSTRAPDSAVTIWSDSVERAGMDEPAVPEDHISRAAGDLGRRDRGADLQSMQVCPLCSLLSLLSARCSLLLSLCSLSLCSLLAAPISLLLSLCSLSLLAARCSLLASHFALRSSRFSLLASRFSSRFSLLASRFSLSGRAVVAAAAAAAP